METSFSITLTRSFDWIWICWEFSQLRRQNGIEGRTELHNSFLSFGNFSSSDAQLEFRVTLGVCVCVFAQ